MSELSEILGSLMVSLVHARRMADEETAAVAEYYKEHPLLEGLSLPRVRVPEVTIDMPITIDQHHTEKAAELESPTVIHKAVTEELRNTLDHENILSATETFRSHFDKEALRALKDIAEKDRKGTVKLSREAIVRAMDTALISAQKKSRVEQELSPEQKSAISKQIRHRVADISVKERSQPAKLVTSAVTSEVKEKSTHQSSVRLKVTLREEGLEWASGNAGAGTKNQLQPE